jgi:hypothetical protein
MLVTSAKGELARKASASDASGDPALSAAAKWQPSVPLLLFTRLVQHQEELAPKIEKVLRAMHAEMADSTNLDDPKERVLFPENAAESDVPLSYFRIESIMLPEAGDRIGMNFDSVFDL